MIGFAQSRNLLDEISTGLLGGLKEWIIGTWLTGRLSQSPATSLRHLARPLLPLRAWNELDQDNCSNASSDLHRITGDDDAHSLRWPRNPRPPSRFVLLLIIASDQPIPFGRPRTHPSFHIPLQWFPPLELDSVHSIFLTHLLFLNRAPSWFISSARAHLLIYPGSIRCQAYARDALQARGGVKPGIRACLDTPSRFLTTD